jgi:hypothetical protein
MNSSNYQFTFIDEKIKNVNMTFFNKNFEVFLTSFSDDLSFNFFNFDFIEKSDYIFDLDHFFVKNFEYSSKMIRYNFFHTDDFKLLSDEFFDFFPIVKKYMLNKTRTYPDVFNFKPRLKFDKSDFLKDFFDFSLERVSRFAITSTF